MRSNVSVKCQRKFEFRISSAGGSQGVGGGGERSLAEDQPSVSQGKQNKSTAGLMAKEVLAVDTLKKKLEYEFGLQINIF